MKTLGLAVIAALGGLAVQTQATAAPASHCDCRCPVRHHHVRRASVLRGPAIAPRPEAENEPPPYPPDYGARAYAEPAYDEPVYEEPEYAPPAVVYEAPFVGYRWPYLYGGWGYGPGWYGPGWRGGGFHGGFGGHFGGHRR
jgi:hypothetical protein